MIIDSQPLTVAILAALLFGESIGVVGAGGLVLGVIGLLLLEASLSILSFLVKTYDWCCNLLEETLDVNILFSLCK